MLEVQAPNLSEMLYTRSRKSSDEQKSATQHGRPNNVAKEQYLTSSRPSEIGFLKTLPLGNVLCAFKVVTELSG